MRAILLLLPLLLIACRSQGRDETPAATSPAPANRERARVVRVVDGDTILVNINGRRERLRYIGVNSPESVAEDRPVECFGKESSEANTRLVDRKTVELERDISDRDRFGRLLRYVYADGVFVNAELIREGYAFAVTFPPDVRENTHLRALEREARETGKGLWGACGR